MAYSRVPTDQEVTLQNGETAEPLLTLADEHGGRAQIVNDDHCYMLLLLQPDGTYKKTAWWFREAVVALRDLPLPE